ncbi:MAG: RNase adapter RapZ [Christensenellaceae bacterium]|nr:RNase adapter RapZ [Christensenellaceae bacterium]
MKAFILTGMSGAGKTMAIRHMEDLGVLCVDNLPPIMIPRFLEACSNIELKTSMVAISVDIRSGSLFDAEGVSKIIEEARMQGYIIETIFLEASDETLLNRYKETRREHPLSSKTIGIPEAIKMERQQVGALRESANYLIDTSDMKAKQLQKKIGEIVLSDKAENQGLMVEIISFGFKRGVPRECDLVFDVRFLPNPFYIPVLGRHTGLDEDVKEFVLENDITKEFMQKFEDMISFLIPHYINEGKNRLVIGIGCTGGAHRSVAIAENINLKLNTRGYTTAVTHRDLELEQNLWKTMEG